MTAPPRTAAPERSNAIPAIERVASIIPGGSTGKEIALPPQDRSVIEGSGTEAESLDHPPFRMSDACLSGFVRRPDAGLPERRDPASAAVSTAQIWSLPPMVETREFFPCDPEILRRRQLAGWSGLSGSVSGGTTGATGAEAARCAQCGETQPYTPGCPGSFETGDNERGKWGPHGLCEVGSGPACAREGRPVATHTRARSPWPSFLPVPANPPGAERAPFTAAAPCVRTLSSDRAGLAGTACAERRQPSQASGEAITVLLLPIVCRRKPVRPTRSHFFGRRPRRRARGGMARVAGSSTVLPGGAPWPC